MSIRNQKILIITLIAISIVPIFAYTSFPNEEIGDTTKDWFLYFSAITGYIGTVFILWDYILGTRSVSALISKDTSWNLKAHKYLGIYGMLFVFAHPILAALKFNEALIPYLLRIRFGDAIRLAQTYGRISFYPIVLVWITSAVFRNKISYRTWKYIHYSSYITLPLAFLHATKVGTQIMSSDELLYYWYFLSLVYIVFFALRLRHVFSISKIPHELVNKKSAGDNIWLYRFKSLTVPINVRPGQYVYVQPKLRSEEHPFTVLDYNVEKGEIVFGIKTFGKFTKKLQGLEIGDRVFLDGPYGVYTQKLLEDVIKPTVLIAGGVGITPFMKHIINGSNSSKLFLFYCNRTSNANVFEQLGAKILGKRFVSVISRESHANSGWSDEQRIDTSSNLHDENLSTQVEYGYFNDAIFRKHISNPAECEYFICGGEGLIKTAQEVLLKNGVNKTQIHVEGF